MNEERAGTECKEAPSAPAAAPSQHQPTEPPKEAQAAARETRATSAAVDPAPKPPLIRWLLRRLRPRFSLRTLLVATLLACSAFTLWLHWEPWVPVARMENSLQTIDHLAFAGDGSRVVGLDRGEGVHVWNAWTGNLVSLRPNHKASTEVLLVSQGRSLRAEADPEFPEPPLVFPEEWAEPLSTRISCDFAGAEEYYASNRTAPPGWIDPPAVAFIGSINMLLGWEDGEPPVLGLRTYPEPPPLRLSSRNSKWELERSLPVSHFEDATIKEILEAFHQKGGWRYLFRDGSIEVLLPYAAQAQRKHSVRLWDLETGAFVKELPESDGRAIELRTTRDGRFLLARALVELPPVEARTNDQSAEGLPKERLWVWSTDDFHCRGQMPLVNHGALVEASASADGKRVSTNRTSTGEDGFLVWSTEREGVVLEVPCFGPVAYTQLSPDGKCLAVALADGQAQFWDVETGAVINRWPVPPFDRQVDSRWEGCFEFSRDGRRLVTQEGNYDEYWKMGFRDGRTGEPLDIETSVDPGVDYTCYDADGRRVLISFGPSAAGLWDIRDGACLGKAPAYRVDPDSDKMMAAVHWVRDRCTPWPGQPERANSRVANPFVGVTAAPGVKAIFSPDGNLLLNLDQDGPYVLERRRPEWWWGVAWLPEFWLTAVFALALLWSLRRDWKQLRHAKPKSSVPGA